MAGQAYYPLMTPAQVKDTLPDINDNIPSELLEQHIKIVQQMKIRPLLGYDYLYQLQDQVSGSSLTTANQFIMTEYLDMIISLHSQKRLVMGQSYQLENNGLRTKLSDVSNLADTQDITYYRSYIENDIDFLVTKKKKYIDANPSDYPLYITRTDVRQNSSDEGRLRYGGYGFSLGSVENDCWKLR